MKYNQEQHKQFLESNLLSIFSSLDIPEDKLSSITMSEIRDYINETYPLLPNAGDAGDAIETERMKTLAAAIENLYYYKLIQKREQL